MRAWADYKKTIKEEDVIFSYARNGNLDSLMKLALLGENKVNEKNHKGYSALMLATYHGHLKMAEYLLQNKADPNSKDLSGNTILMGAAFKVHLDLVQLLVESGADVNVLNSKNQSALDFATLFGRVKVVLFLKSIQQKPENFSLIDIFSSWSSYLLPKRKKTNEQN